MQEASSWTCHEIFFERAGFSLQKSSLSTHAQVIPDHPRDAKHSKSNSPHLSTLLSNRSSLKISIYFDGRKPGKLNFPGVCSVCPATNPSFSHPMAPRHPCNFDVAWTAHGIIRRRFVGCVLGLRFFCVLGWDDKIWQASCFRVICHQSLEVYGNPTIWKPEFIPCLSFNDSVATLWWYTTITMENHHFFMGKSTINGNFQ